MNLVSYTENAMLRSFNSQERLVVNVLVSRNSSSWLSFSKEFVGTSFRHLADRSGRAQIRNLPTKGSLMMGGSHSKDEMPSYSIQETVPVINKRTIGKLIVRHCGNEGQQDDPTLVVNLRTILQATITKLDTESEETWKNAEIVIYDQLGNDFCIRSGEAENKFVVQLDEKDEIRIICTNRKKTYALASFFTRKSPNASKPSKTTPIGADSRQ